MLATVLRPLNLALSWTCFTTLRKRDKSRLESSKDLSRHSWSNVVPTCHETKDPGRDQAGRQSHRSEGAERRGQLLPQERAPPTGVARAFTWGLLSREAV